GPRIVATQKCPGRACGNAAVTGTAEVVLEGEVVLQLEVEEDGAEKVVGAALRLDQHRVAAEPAEAGTRRELPLQHRPSVHVRPPPHGGQLLVDPVLQLDQARGQDVMVVEVPRVAREDRAVGAYAL